MIEIRRGNLLESDAEAYVNTVNCVGVMGKGIALQFKQAFPDNFRQYENACKEKQIIPGKVFLHETGRLMLPKFIINFPTKRHWKGKSRIEDIEAGLTSLIAEVENLGLQSVAVPPLGCGNGGLAWDQVRPLIESAFGNLPSVKVLLYEPHGAPVPDDMPIRTKAPEMTRARALFIRLIDLYRIPEYRLSLLEIQKLAYFLQCAGEPLRLNFVKHNYGPYADNLNHVLQVIEGHFIRGYGDRSSGAQIRVLPEGRQKADAYLEKDSDTARQLLSSVAKLIEGFETPYGMELLSSTHWVAAQEDTRARSDPEHAIRGVHRWNQRKRKTFNPRHIMKAWQRLQNQDWLDRACCELA